MSYAREAPLTPAKMEGPDGQVLERYVAYCTWPDMDGIQEEIDLDATSKAAAKQLAAEVLERDYEPGGKVARVEMKFGMYL